MDRSTHRLAWPRLVASAIVAAVCAIAACGSSDTEAAAPAANRAEVFSPKVTKVVFEMAYAPGAEPWMGGVGGSTRGFLLMESNVQRLFGGSAKTVEIPDSLDQMATLDGVTQTDFTAQDLLDIASTHRRKSSTGDSAAYYILWLNGFYSSVGQRNDAVLGVSVGDGGVIAIFKPALQANLDALVSSIETPADKLRLTADSRLVEQMVMLHEFGHAVGLVNDGLSMAAPHQDEEHGHHCGNPNCLMYWMNSRFNSVRQFVTTRITSDESAVFDDACLADAAAYAK